MKCNVVFITDENFYIPTIVAIQSFIDSQPTNDKTYCIHIMHKGLSEKQILLFKGMKSKSFSIEIIDVREQYEKLDLSKLANHLCTAKVPALLKFEISDLFEELDSILYLDGDVVIKSDISSIFDIKLYDNYVAGVRDCGVATYNKKAHEHLKLNFDKYINTGFMLLNLKKMREDNVREKLYEAKYTLGDKSKMDQNIFNLVFDDKIHLLPLKYNCTFPNDYLEYLFGKLDLGVLNKIHRENYKSWEQVHKNASIIHYSAPIKPWKYSDAMLVSYWNESFEKTPLAGEVILKRKKLHLDLLTRFCKGRKRVLIVRAIINLRVKGFANTIEKVRKYICNKVYVSGKEKYGCKI